jgi:hypothetical protein
VIGPATFSSKEACAEPSPQSTSTLQGASVPGSEKEPRSNTVAWPSSDLWLGGAVTVGGTFAIATTWTASESVSLAPSESATLTETLVLLGPSAKKQRKLPPVAVVWGEPETRLPLSPQLCAVTANVSSPGSDTVKVYVSVSPSLTWSLPERLTVGATLATETCFSATLLSAVGEPAGSSASRTCMATVGEAGPSAKRQSKLPPLPAASSCTPPWRLPPTPQFGNPALTVKPSSPGSETVNV